MWRHAFIRMPYAREHLVKRAIIADTFETAITWERFEAFHDRSRPRPKRLFARRPDSPGR